jgi:hypothetical protein
VLFQKYVCQASSELSFFTCRLPSDPHAAGAASFFLWRRTAEAKKFQRGDNDGVEWIKIK